MDSFLTKMVVRAAKYYARLPVRPFGSILGKLYSGYLNSGNNRSVVTKKIDGINFELDLREIIDYEMYFKGSREPNTSNALRKLCKQGNIVFDIGANVGSHTLPVASYVGEEGKVYAFEPVPWAMNRLKRNLELNSFNNLVLEGIALSDTNEKVEMKFRASFKIGSNSGVGKDGKIDESWWSECEKVNVRLVTMDSYVSNHQISRLDLIKLDVDGFEGKVIRGGLETIKRFKPKIIMEVAPAWTEMRGDNIKDILRGMENMGYIFYMESDFRPIQDINVLIDALPSEGGFNVLASVQNPV